jgi:acetyl-CoA carboxylase biotin carboxyl carrier protein
VNSDHTRPDQKRPEVAERAERPSGTSPQEAGAVLEAVCRSVTELARATPKPPRRIRMQDGHTQVEIEWPDPIRADVPSGAHAVAAVLGEEPGAPAEEPVDPPAYVRAPMVGTFYHAGSPDSPPFVQVGDIVQQGQQVGVLEAMKIMNRVTADASGRVVEVLVADAERVQFDEPLIALESGTNGAGA